MFLAEDEWQWFNNPLQMTSMTEMWWAKNFRKLYEWPKKVTCIGKISTLLSETLNIILSWSNMH